MSDLVGRVHGLWRYPVKSLGGEALEALRLDQRGAEYDRLWALVDGDGRMASGKTSKRFRKVPGLLLHASRVDNGAPVIQLVDGRTGRVGSDDANALVREIAGPDWSIRREESVSHFDAGSIHIVTTTTLDTLSAATGRTVSVERLRPNLLLETDSDGFPEDAWLGRVIRIGEVELKLTERVIRCVMVNQARPTMRARRDVLKTIGRINDTCAGVYGDVLAPGTIGRGDEVRLIS